MDKTSFQVAQEALTSLQFFRDSYASGESYQAHRKQIVKMLRKIADNNKDTRYGDYRFLHAFADAIIIGTKKGEYQSQFLEDESPRN